MHKLTQENLFGERNTINRVFHHYSKWEDFRAGLYSHSQSENLVQLACKVLGNDEPCHSSMMEVVTRWKHSCECQLTNMSRNRRAWLGQAACCISDGVPENLTKIAWNLLNDAQQATANLIADDVIKHWEQLYLQGKN